MTRVPAGTAGSQTQPERWRGVDPTCSKRVYDPRSGWDGWGEDPAGAMAWRRSSWNLIWRGIIAKSPLNHALHLAREANQ